MHISAMHCLFPQQGGRGCCFILASPPAVRVRQPGALYSCGTTTAGARHCTSLIYSGRRPNQYMQGFLVRAVGGARESDQTPAENLRSQSRPPAVRASRPRCIGARVQGRWRQCQPVVVGGGAAAPIAPLPMCAFPYALLWCIGSSGSSAVISRMGWRRSGRCDGSAPDVPIVQC